MGYTQKLGLLAQSVFQDSSLNVGIGGAPSGSYKFEVTGTAKVSGITSLTSATASTSTTTGGLVVTGGVGIGGALFGTSATFSGLITYSGTSQILNAASGTTGYLYQYLANTTGAAYFGLERSTGGGLFTGSSNYATVLGSATATSLQFGTNGIVRTTITSAGDVGIGTTLPSGIVNGGGLVIYNSLYPRLILQNSTTGTSTNAYSGMYMVGNDMYVQNPLATLYLVTLAGSSVMTIKTTGNVLITAGNGTYPASNSTSYGLQIFDNTTMAANVGGSLIFQGYKTATSSAGNFAGIVGKKENGTAGDESGFLGFLTGNSGGTFSEKMRITSAGDVAINDTTANTYAKMQVTATSGATFALANPSAAAAGVGSSIWFYGTTGYNTQGVISTGYDGTSNVYAYMTFSTRGPSTTERMRIASGGQVYIGTTTGNRQLNVFESIGVRVNQTGTEQEIFFLGRTGSGVNDGLFTIADNNVRKVNIAANNARGGDTYFNGGGNVAIGTDTPSYKLHVNGTAYATGAAGALSDIRHKNNVLDINAGLDAVMLLRPVSYLWNDDFITDNGMQGLHFGFIAQEVKEILPDVILEQNNEEKTLGLKYNEIIPVLVKAIQELTQKVNALENK
jgi:hypothetical protein